MTIENKGKVITPSAGAPSFDAMQVFPLDTTRTTSYALSAGGNIDVALSDDCEMIRCNVKISSDDEFPIVGIKRGEGDEFEEMFSGIHYWGVVKDVRTINLSLPGTGTATVKITEA